MLQYQTIEPGTLQLLKSLQFMFDDAEWGIVKQTLFLIEIQGFFDDYVYGHVVVDDLGAYSLHDVAHKS